MKYVAYWLGTVAIGTLVVLAIAGGIKLIELISVDPALLWIPGAILGLIAIATLVAVVEYISDRRTAEGTPESQQ